ncbi:hypothetical protein [Prescottella equi]
MYGVFSAVCLMAAVGLLVAAIVIDPSSALDWGSPVIAIGALAVAASSRMQARRSADAAVSNAKLAELQENRRKFGWQVEPHPTQDHYILRNVGTVTATNVEIANSEQFAWARILSTDEGTVAISPGEARVFVAPLKFDSHGYEVHIRWVPESETVPRTWIETVQPSATAAASRVKRADHRREDHIRNERLAIEEAREQRDLILRLGDAYAEYRADPSDAGKKLRVQLLVAALPPRMAREIGHEVDVARDVWGPWEYPFTQQVLDEDWPRVENLMPQIELIWNMRHLEGTPVYDATESMPKSTEPRIEWAIRGYIDRVKAREAGERPTRHSPRDQTQADETQRLFKGLEERRNGGASREAGDTDLEID